VSLQLYDDDALSALSPGASSQCTESAGLVAGAAIADVHAAGGKRPAQSAAANFSVADILRWGAPQATGLNTPARVRDTLAKLAICRTHVMGGRMFKCQDCHETTSLYNSCGDRHCVRV